MGSNLKKIRSLNLNTKILLVGMLFPLGFLGTFLLNNFLKDNYNSRKSELEDSIGNFLNKKVPIIPKDKIIPTNKNFVFKFRDLIFFNLEPKNRVGLQNIRN